ncbi:hypothetical protein PO909_022200 [Leuciscus waleckii]
MNYELLTTDQMLSRFCVCRTSDRYANVTLHITFIIFTRSVINYSTYNTVTMSMYSCWCLFYLQKCYSTRLCWMDAVLRHWLVVGYAKEASGTKMVLYLERQREAKPFPFVLELGMAGQFFGEWGNSGTVDSVFFFIISFLFCFLRSFLYV